MRYKQLLENISLTNSINQKIEDAISGYDQEKQRIFLDIIDVLHQSGKNGLTPAAWADQLKKLYPGMVLKDSLKECVNLFKDLGLILRTGDGRYIWEEHYDDLESADPALRDAIGGTIDITNQALAALKDKELTFDKWTQEIKRQHPQLDVRVIKMFVERLPTIMPANVVPGAQTNTWTWKKI